jgi:predicted metal-binding membrane protein
MAQERRIFVALFASLVASAWLALALWGLSPYAELLRHDALADAGPSEPQLVLLPVAGWMLMTVAMMLPSSLPLIGTFHAMTRRREDGLRLLLLLVGGYLAVWALVGFAVHAADLTLHDLAGGSWLERNPWLIGAGTLALAGAYQFSSLKYRCLEKCRSPLAFVSSRWRGGRDGSRAFGLGVSHGAYCVGCCWSLMLVMFAVGVGSLGWMLALGAVMAAEKTTGWGRRLTKPLGAALLTGAAVLVLANAAPAAASHTTSFETSGSCTEAAVGALVDHALAQRHVAPGFTVRNVGGKALLVVFSEACTTAVGPGAGAPSTVGGASVSLDPANSPAGCAAYDFFWTNSAEDDFYAAYRDLGWRMALDTDGRFELSPVGGAALVTAHNRNEVASYELDLAGSAIPPTLPEVFLDSIHCHVGPRGLVKAGPFHHEPLAVTGAAGTLRVEPGSLLWELLGERESVAVPALYLVFDFQGRTGLVGAGA